MKQRLGPVIAILEHVPERWYGDESKLVRHSVLVAMAKYANSKGENIWASEARIAHTARVSLRAAHNAIAFWEKSGRIRQRGVHPTYGTKMYDLVLPTTEDADEAKRERSEALEKERTRTRKRVAKFREKAACNGTPGVTEKQNVTASPALRNGTTCVTVTADRAECNAQDAVDLSFDLSPDLSEEREKSAKAEIIEQMEIVSLSPVSSDSEKQKPEATPSAEADYEKFRQEFREWTGMAAMDNKKMRTRYAELAAKYGQREVFDAIPRWVRRDDRSDNKQWAAYNFLFDLAEYIIEEQREELQQRPGRGHQQHTYNPARRADGTYEGELPQAVIPER